MQAGAGSRCKKIRLELRPGGSVILTSFAMAHPQQHRHLVEG